MLSDINFKYLKMFIGDYTDLDFSGVLNYYIVCSGVNSGSPDISLKIIVNIPNFRLIYKRHLNNVISRSDEDGVTVYELSPEVSYVTLLKRHADYGEVIISVPSDLFNLEEIYTTVLAKYGIKTVELIKSTFLSEDYIECFSTNEQRSHYSFSSETVIESQVVINAITALGFKLSDRIYENDITKLIFRDVLNNELRFTISEDNIVITFRLQ